jgi:hypothetical protein
MITISTKELKRFTSLATHIKNNGIIPIYGYVKIEAKGGVATMYKSNAQSFIVFPVDGAVCNKDETILVEEKVLFGFINTTSRQSVSISQDGKDGNIDDGKRPVKFIGIEDHYPVIQQKAADAVPYEFDLDVLSALSLAKQHTLPPQDKTIREWNTFVHISKCGDRTGIAGFNGFTWYFQTFKEKLPELVLDTDVIAIISKFQSAAYSQSGNYDIFECAGVTYGFIKPEVKPRELTKFMESLSKGEKKFKVVTKSITEYCESVLAMNNTSLTPDITVEPMEGKKILLKHVGYGGVDIEEEVFIEEKDGDFDTHYFNPNYILLALKGIPFDEVEVSVLENQGFVFSSPEEPHYLGGVVKMSPVQSN